jgi:hypothetical protein
LKGWLETMINQYPLKVEKSNTITDPKVLTKYIASFLLGDGSITTDSKFPNNNKRFVCTQILPNEDYILWRADILSNISPVNIYLRAHKEGQNNSLTTITRSLPFYTNFRERLYISGIKRIDPHYLKLLDWEMMAIFYQDDGNLHIDRGTPYIKLCTNGYSYGDHLIFVRAVKEKLHIEMNIVPIREKNGIQYNLKLPRRFVEKFIEGVSPYVLPSFQYKLDLSNVKLLPRRNVVYTKHHTWEDGDIVRSALNMENAALAEMTKE